MGFVGTRPWTVENKVSTGLKMKKINLWVVYFCGGDGRRLWLLGLRSGRREMGGGERDWARIAELACYIYIYI